MDALVVLAGIELPAPVASRSRHIVHIKGPDVPADVLGDLRGRIPRSVGVFGPIQAATQCATELHKAGLPVVLYLVDPADPVPAIDGVALRKAYDDGEAMDVANNLIELIGDTPMMRLDRTARDLECTLLAKLEFFNPGGSTKDRPALNMILEAERQGLLKPGGTIVEPTSGNTGVGLAIVAAQRRYKCVFVVPDKVAKEKISLLRAYGAEVHVCPTSVEPDSPESYYSVAERLTNEIPGAFRPNQYHNQANPQAHTQTTGPEIWRQTAGRITHFVAGAGTGGTLAGIGHYLKSMNPNVQVIAADPEGSVYSGGSGRPYLVEGVGEDFWPSTYDPAVVDRVIMVPDAESFSMARRVTKEEGLLIGGSSGMAVSAALEIARDLPADAVVVVLIPDSGRGYLSKVFDDGWMADHGFLRAAGPTVGDLLSDKDSNIPALVHTHPHETVRTVISIFQEFGVSQMPVVKHEPPLQAAEVVGAVSEVGLMGAAFNDPTVLDNPVGDVMGAKLPQIGMGDTVDHAVRVLEQSEAVLVLDKGHPVGVVSRADVLEFLTKNQNT